MHYILAAVNSAALPAATDLLTVDELVCYMGWDAADFADTNGCNYRMAVMFIESALAAVEFEVGYPLRAGLYDTKVVETCDDILLYGKNLVLDDPASGVVYGTDTWVKRSDGTLVPLDMLNLRPQQGVIEQCDCCCCLCSCCKKCKYISIRIKAGYDPLAGCMKQVLMETVAQSFETQAAAKYITKASSTTSTAGVTGLLKSEKIGDYQVVYENFPDSTSTSSSSGGGGCGCDDAVKKLSLASRNCIKQHKIIHLF